MWMSTFGHDFIQNEIISAVKRVEFVCDRMSYLMFMSVV